MSIKPHRTTSDMVNQFSQEPDYSDPGGDDFDALSRDRLLIRSLEARDLEAVLAIDARITGRDRRLYYERRFQEVLERSGIRVSLVAEHEGQVAGFVMARVDYGEFGCTDTSAIIDTIGVAPTLSGQGVGRGLLSQLFRNLASLRVDIVRTEVAWEDYALNRFLGSLGFRPSQRLALRLPLG